MYSSVQCSTVQQEHHEENIALQAMGLGPYPFIGMLALAVLIKNLMVRIRIVIGHEKKIEKLIVRFVVIGHY